MVDLLSIVWLVLSAAGSIMDEYFLHIIALGLLISIVGILQRLVRF